MAATADLKPFMPTSSNSPYSFFATLSLGRFPLANFNNLLNAIAGLVVILSAQFDAHDFSPAAPGLALSGYGGPPAGYDNAIGGYFLVKFPDNWPTVDRYDFDWDGIKSDADPFANFPFP
jgi:hypothetical protein